jgi:hypothetical protein
MLRDLVQVCPYGEAQTRIFRYLFLQRLPTEIRIILAEDRDSTLAARANQLRAHSTRQPHNATVNAVLDDEGHETIAAVSSSLHFVAAVVDGDVAARAALSAVMRRWRPSRVNGGSCAQQSERPLQAGQAVIRSLQVPLAIW